jgi:phage terminase large subunit GpA-like protein
MNLPDTTAEDLAAQRLTVLTALQETMRERMKPPPKLTVSQWADRYRKLSAEASAEPGQWITARNEPMRGVMDAVSDPLVVQVTVMSSAQVGKTETLSNILGYHIAQDPAPILFVQPTLNMAETYSKDRLAPMVRDTPALSGKIADSKSRDSNNTLLKKNFPGGHVTLTGANSPADLASRPIRVVLLDEVDRYPPSAGSEGDPVNLAIKRTTTFWNKKILLTSTPTVKGVSRIEMAWEASDQRRYHVACPDCQGEQHLKWAQVHWPEGQPLAAEYACEHCGSLWGDAARWRALKTGRWIASAPFNGNAGFHLNEIYSPWVRLGDMARGFLDAKKSPETLKTWVNTSLGESFEETGEKVDDNALASRGEDWNGKAPAGVLVVTAGIDVQDDRFEVERVGWGVDEESWSLEHRVIYGDPSAPAIWAELDAYLAETTPTADGRTLAISASAIDSGGHHTQAVYKFAKDRAKRRVWAIKGMPGKRPVWPPKASKNNIGKVNLFLVGVDSAKDSIYSRLRIAEPGPGYSHFPKGRDPSYFAQLTAETVVTKYVKGFPARVWQKRPGARNEALDCRVYAYAALQSLNVKWGRELEKRARHAVPTVAATPLQASVVEFIPEPAPTTESVPQTAPKSALQRLGARRVIRPGYR